MILVVYFRKVLVAWCGSVVALLQKLVHVRKPPTGLGEPLLATADDTSSETRVGPKTPYPSHRRVIELFDDRVREAPQRTALVVPDGHGDRREVSYGELGQLVDVIARRLALAGAGRGKVVALVLGRSVA